MTLPEQPNPYAASDVDGGEVQEPTRKYGPALFMAVLSVMNYTFWNMITGLDGADARGSDGFPIWEILAAWSIGALMILFVLTLFMIARRNRNPRAVFKIIGWAFLIASLPMIVQFAGL